MYVSYFIRHTLVRAAARSKDPEAPRARRWAHTEELLDRLAVEVVDVMARRAVKISSSR